MYADGYVENLGRAREATTPHATPFTNATITKALDTRSQVTDSLPTSVDESGLWSLLRLDDGSRQNKMKTGASRADKTSGVFK